MSVTFAFIALAALCILVAAFGLLLSYLDDRADYPPCPRYPEMPSTTMMEELIEETNREAADNLFNATEDELRETYDEEQGK